VGFALPQRAFCGRNDKTVKKEFERQWIGGRKPTQEEISEAIEQLTQFNKGRILGKDVTIKDLINEGRRY
jgi:hypothetical protein